MIKQIVWDIRCFFYDLMMKENKKHPNKVHWKSKLFCKLSGIFWKIAYKITPRDEWLEHKYHRKQK